MFKFFKQEKLSEDEIRDRSIQTMGNYNFIFYYHIVNVSNYNKSKDAEMRRKFKDGAKLNRNIYF
jgi:hypothetical protein